MRKKYRLTYNLLAVTARYVRSLSVANRERLAQRLAGVVFHYFPIRKDIALRNLRRAFPAYSSNRRQTILKYCYLSYIRNFLQFFALPDSYRRAPITINGKNLLDTALREGKGVLLIAGHFGSWEILAAWLGYNRYPFVGVAQRQKNRGADKFFRELRERSGIRHIFRKASLDKMYAVLKNGEILGLASDQDARKRGVFVKFFDQPASTPKGAAMFHLRQGAPMLFISCYETKPYQYVIDIEPIPVKRGDDVTAITQQFTSLLEKKVRQYPSQYFWFHRRWKTKINESGSGRKQP